MEPSKIIFLGLSYMLLDSLLSVVKLSVQPTDYLILSLLIFDSKGTMTVIQWRAFWYKLYPFSELGNENDGIKENGTKVMISTRKQTEKLCSAVFQAI